MLKEAPGSGVWFVLEVHQKRVTTLALSCLGASVGHCRLNADKGPSFWRVVCAGVAPGGADHSRLILSCSVH